MDGKGAWRDNVFVERLWRTIKYEEVYLRAYTRECPIFCVTAVWSMLPERSKDDDDFQGTAGRTSEGLRAA